MGYEEGPQLLSVGIDVKAKRMKNLGMIRYNNRRAVMDSDMGNE